MEWSLVMKCLWVSLVLLLPIQRCLGCWEEERIALLEIKAFFQWTGAQDGSWVDGKESSDCCAWERVECNATTGRVIQLSLSFMSLSNGAYLNVTLFSAFQELQYLNLSYNSFHGWIGNEGFDRLVGLRKLEVLDLTFNHFNNNILPFLRSLTSLRTLFLAFNFMKGSSHWEELANLQNLQSLDLSGNSIEASLQTIQGFKKFGGLQKLEVLDLSGNLFNNSILPSLGAITSLRKLYLSVNNFDGSSHFEGFERLVGLKTLEVLDLRGNGFNTNILPSLGALTSLRTLSLAENYLNGSSHWEELANLHNLQSLDLSWNSIGASLQTIQGFRRLIDGLQMLEVLDLRGNLFNSSILQSLGKLKSLKKLSLSYNNIFQGSSHFEELSTMHKLQSLDLSCNSINASSSGKIQGLCQLKSLHELYLQGNNFEGFVPPCLKNLTSLRMLDLSQNRFKGDIPSSLISSLTSLVSISLSNNDFDGLFPFISFANSSNLESIDLCSAGNNLTVETEYPSWVPPFQLKVLLLSNNNLNAIPRFLTNQHNLRQVDLSDNNMKGLFPTWLLENNKMLRDLRLRNNLLSGHFVLPSDTHKAANILDISDNGINGLLQANIGKMLPNIVSLNLSNNYFDGPIPSSIANMKLLSGLDLSNNKISGEIPSQMAIISNNLVGIRLSNNRLHGPILPPYFNWTHLTSLHLDNNLFLGNISTGLSKCSRLQILDIGNNMITGSIPNWIGNLTWLDSLIMRGNFLEGNIPVEFSKLSELTFLDLSQNFLVGSMPSILNSTSLGYLHLQGNRFTRTPQIAHFNSSSLLTLDIRDNDLHGVIPEWIGSLSNLRVLLLKQNHFNGSIPNYLCQLAWINVIDLSHNALSGSIPQCLNNISFGRLLGTGPTFYKMGLLIEGPTVNDYMGNLEIAESEEVDFIMRNRFNSYQGDILNLVSGLDLSCNNLRNEIPSEIGDLNGILTLNLSHNQLTGPILGTLSNLTQIESLDLSYNKLSGKIPSELSILYSLEVFSMAYNNLSGKTPDMNNGQFSTFGSTSYEGNPFLCGPPLPRGCSSNTESTRTSATPSIGVKGDDDIDISAFFASFAASYVMTLLGFAAVFYINPYWRRIWFRFIGQCIDSCHEFLSNTWYKLVIRTCT